MKTEPIVAYLALGANLGDRIAALRAAVDGLDAHSALDLIRASPVYETRAHTLDPDEVQPTYFNAVVEVETALSPEALLAYAHDLERASGRRREAPWQPRTLDLDLLVVGMETRQGPDFYLPHPRLGERRFVLQPWWDLAPNLYVPAPFDATVADLLNRCPDPDEPVRTGFLLRQPYNPI